MQDIPPEITVALEVVKSLTASGRCREDAALYASATQLLTTYLTQAAQPALPVAVPTISRQTR